MESGMLKTVRAYLAGELGFPEADLAELMRVFMESFGGCVEELRALDGRPDYAAIRAVTHKIFGFARNVGATELDDAAMLLNAAAKQCSPEACEAGVRLLVRLYEACLSEQ